MATGNFAGRGEPNRKRYIDLSLWAKYQKHFTYGSMRSIASFSITTGSGVSAPRAVFLLSPDSCHMTSRKRWWVWMIRTLPVV